MSNNLQDENIQATARSVLKSIKYRIVEIIDPSKRRRRRETRKDFIQTRNDLGSFINIGRRFETKKEAFAILSLTNIPLQAKFHGLIAKAMQLDGYSPIIINSSKHVIAERYFKLFGFEDYINWDEKYREIEDIKKIDDIAPNLFSSLFSLEAIKSINYRNVPIGKYAFSRTCRDLKKFPVDVNEDTFQKSLKKNIELAIMSTLAAEQLFNSYPIRKLMVRDIGYVPNGPLFSVAMDRNVDCVVIANGQKRGTWIFKRYTNHNIGEHEFSISKSTWEHLRTLPWTQEMDKKVDDEFFGRYSPKSDDDIRRLQTGKRQYDSSEVRQILELNSAKKTAVIFAHVSWDGAFFFGNDLFKSFDDWLVQTTRCAFENPNLNWLIKLHPLNVLKHAFEGNKNFIEGEIEHLRQLGKLPENIKILHSDSLINTASLFSVIDYGITVRGTIGLELPCLGIPVLTAGTGRYEGRGFTIDSEDQSSYFEKLLRLHEIPPLSEESIRLARVHYYYLMCRRQISFEDIAPMTVNQLHEADTSLFNNIHINAESLEDIRESKSIQQLVDWFHQPHELDLLSPYNINARNFAMPSSPIVENYSGAASRFSQNYRALTDLIDEVHVASFHQNGEIEALQAFESKSAEARNVKKFAASWRDVVLPSNSRVHGKWNSFKESLIDPVSYLYPSSRTISQNLTELDREINPDFFWLEDTIVAAAAVQNPIRKPWIYSHHDIQSRLHRIRGGSDGLRRRWLLHTMLRVDKKVTRSATAILTGSTTDRLRLQAMGNSNVQWIPVSSGTHFSSGKQEAESIPRIIHLGSLETTANRIGLEAYLRKAHSEVISECQKKGIKIELFIIGDNSRVKNSLAVQLDQANIVAKGFITDLGTALHPFDIAILPYEFDTGYRTKLSLLMSYGIVIVATKSAIAGTQIDGLLNACVVADRLEDFPVIIADLASKPQKREEIGRAAYDFFINNLSHSATKPKYKQLITNLVGKSNYLE